MKKIISITVCLVFFAMTAWSQTRTPLWEKTRVITGRVLLVEKDTPLEVIVCQKGTQNAIFTDSNGTFSLFVSDTVIDLSFEACFPGIPLLLKGIPMTKDTINLSQIFLQQYKFISKKKYKRLNEFEQKNCIPMLGFDGFIGYQCCEVENNFKCPSDPSIINKYEFDKACMVIEFKNYKICP